MKWRNKGGIEEPWGREESTRELVNVLETGVGSKSTTTGEKNMSAPPDYQKKAGLAAWEEKTDAERGAAF